ncbi:hypothetical protein QBC45DRAFT_13462 [Copromyces sp. CBS 386.78]|nr:hypothetical protein QBC45DRAFT_13462 [Copromyces sp. CBS 386.78]
MERNRHSSSCATAFSGASTMDSGPTSFPEMEAEDPYLPNLWICDVKLTDDQELVMEHLIAHLNHPRVVSLQATANAIYALMALQTVSENYKSSDTSACPLSSSSIQLTPSCQSDERVLVHLLRRRKERTPLASDVNESKDIK